ncbi:hypothetical protein AGMMS4957_21440 [Bacteroidia bacterium]|nr:hypothetical protein AGMMS4957_21440 [Bacteroidia bacterium]
MSDFEEYIRQGEPQKKERGYAWQTAIGLQAVDGLKPSDYLIATARQHIEGDITIDEVRQLIKSYYESKGNRTSTEQLTEQPIEQLTEQERLLLSVMGNEHFTLKMLMEKIGLKHRPTFLANYINPAIKDGLVKVLYPEKPNHPRQKYLLTVKGTAMRN